MPWGSAVRRGDAEIAQFDVEHPALLPHGIGGIGAEVHEDLLHLDGIGEDQARLAFDVDPDADGRRRWMP